jgi:IrrE N-terminal-like domain
LTVTSFCSLLVLLLAAPAFSQTSLCSEVPSILRQLSEITGMKVRHAVPCAFITKADVNKFLQDRVQEVAKPDDIRGEELTLKKFNFVPADFDLAKNTVDLLTEQAAAFYDYNKKKLFITESNSAESQEPVLAHELGHALADQNYNLAKFVRQGRKNDDGSTARLAVMEGQATWLMSEFLARQSGQSLKTSPDLVTMMAKLSDSSGGQYPVFENEPLYLRTTLIFPYTKGMLFQNSVTQRDGKESFGEVFKNPPVSTQQILHPEKYFSGVKPTDPKLPEVKLDHSYKGLVDGVLGELEHRILIEQAIGAARADEIAPHWRGAKFELVEDKAAGRVVLLYVSEWDTEEAARQYFEAYRVAMQRKWKKMTVAADSAGALTGEGDDGRFELRRTGATVTSVEGLPPAIN